jgi:hypothetical protein
VTRIDAPDVTRASISKEIVFFRDLFHAYGASNGALNTNEARATYRKVVAPE